MLSSTFRLHFSRVPLRRSCIIVRHASRVAPADKKSETTPEEFEKFIRMSESGRLGFDPWAQPTPMLDLHVPTPWSTLLKQANVRDGLKLMRLGLENHISNAVSMFTIARTHSLPWNPMVSPYSTQIFRSSSVKSKTWLDPLREIAHNSYEQVQQAVALNNTEVVRALSTGAYQKRLLARMKTLHPTTAQKSASKKMPSRPTYTWRLHSLTSPIKCVSIRCVQGHLGRQDPPIGTRYIVQACLRFDTLQSLNTISSRSPSPQEPKRVLEYLVFEKKMWYDGPWIIRDQLWEAVLGEHGPSSGGV